MKKKLFSFVIVLFVSMILIGCDEQREKMEPNPDSLVPYIDDEWVAVWADEFNGDTLDLSKWTYEINGSGGGNQELQYYTDKNAIVSDGTLKIIAKKEAYQGKEYTSSRIVTKYNGDFRYGRIVVSAKMPTGRGTWPAVWMMPTDNKYGVWPNSGEIDIMEYVGYDKNVVHTSVHSKKNNHQNNTALTSKKILPNAETEFNTFELIWEPGSIKGFVNGKLFAQFQYSNIHNQDVDYKDVFPFDQRFFLILNLAIGGNWGGQQGVDNAIFPATFEIDYIRVYQKDYNYYDNEKPSKPGNIKAASGLLNSIFWEDSSDDMGVDFYNIYVDGEIYGTTNLPQVTLKKLTKNQKYMIEVEAVDFTGKPSSKSDAFEFTFK